MAHQSTAEFRTLHALRIKGFAKVELLSEMTASPVGDVAGHLDDLQRDGLATFREARALWQLTPDGRAAHADALAADLQGIDCGALGEPYQRFLVHNDSFKLLCGDWQLRDGGPNDHTDAAYDRRVVERLAELDVDARPLVGEMAALLGRLGPYAPRLEQACQRVIAGETNMFTGVMCGSYHDVWMELHEDLILTQSIDRAKEGSY